VGSGQLASSILQPATTNEQVGWAPPTNAVQCRSYLLVGGAHPTIRRPTSFLAMPGSRPEKTHFEAVVRASKPW